MDTSQNQPCGVGPSDLTTGLDAEPSAARSIRHYLANLQYRQTGRDPMANGYAYAEVPDWALRQWLTVVEGRL